MAEVKILSKVEMSFDVLLKLSEEEARALEAIVGYGPDQFVKWFYKNLGKHYLKPHEDAMRSLFSTVRQELGFRLHDINEVKKAISEGKAKLNQPISTP
jgi:hypothetical protein